MLEVVFVLTASAWVSRGSLRAQVVLLSAVLCLLHYALNPFLHLFAASFHTWVLTLCTNY